MIFNDAMLMDLNHMNHNASDRASVYDAWLDYVRSPDVMKHFVRHKEKYDSYHPDTALLETVTGYAPQEFPTEEMDKYAEEVVAEMWSFLEKKI